MNYFRLIFIIFTIFAFSTKANDVQIIELHKNKSLDQLVLEKENNESKSINIENDINITEDSNIIEDNSNSDNIDNQNDNAKNADEQIVNIENETFFDLDNLFISSHFESLKNIKSSTLHREFINILSSIDLDDEKINSDMLYFVIKKLYEMGEIEKAYKLVSKINLESVNIDKQNL